VLTLVLAALAACSSAAQSPKPSRSPDVEAGTVQEFVGEGTPLEPARTRYSEF
jgi:hypothetical protein